MYTRVLSVLSFVGRFVLFRSGGFTVKDTLGPAHRSKMYLQYRAVSIWDLGECPLLKGCSLFGATFIAEKIIPSLLQTPW